MVRWAKCALALLLVMAIATFVSGCTGSMATGETVQDAEPLPTAAIADVSPTAIPDTPVPQIADAPLPPSLPIPDITPSPTPTVVLVGGPPSQSPDDAERDGVIAEVAELSFADRVEIFDETTVGGQRWAISRFPLASWDAVNSVAFSPARVDPWSSELLQLDGDRIVRAVPMFSSPATWIASSNDTVYAGRSGDGAFPNSTVVRVDVATGQATRLMLPWAYAHGISAYRELGWGIVVPSSLDPVRDATMEMLNAPDEPSTFADLDAAMDAAVVMDGTLTPTLATTRTLCADLGSAGYFFDVGTHCIFEEGDRASADTIVVIGDEEIPGTLVGAGWMSPSGPTYAAIVGPPGEFGETPSPLLFVDVDDPSAVWETSVRGREAASEVTQVAFFDGGFVTTKAVDLTAEVRAYDTSGQPLSDFVSPTDADLGYPPDPYTTHAATSPDGKRVIMAQRPWPFSDDGLPGEGFTLLITDAATGDELSRMELALDRDELVRWLDFDGRWAVLSFRQTGQDEGVWDIQDRWPIMIDTDTGEVFSLGFELPAMVSIERSRD